MPDSNTSHHDAAVQIVRRLQDRGHTAYLAGGCVRDQLLGLTPKDYDIATDAEPPVVRALFRGSRYVGEAFGVVLVPVRMEQDRYLIEVATFRTEWGYKDGRRPSRVTFTDAEHDATRRDFTINGLFENPLADNPEERIIDFVDGRRDLERGVIRAIGDAEIRFHEDYLRMLRAVRFAARFGFQIESKTANAIRHHAEDLVKISRERIGQEVKAMLTPGDDVDPARAASLMQESKLDESTLGEEHRDLRLTIVQHLPTDAHYPTVLAAWMLDRHGTDQNVRLSTRDIGDRIRQWRQALCLSNEQSTALGEIIEIADGALAWPGLSVAAQKRLVARAQWSQSWILLNAARSSRGVAVVAEGITSDLPALIAEGVSPPPFVTGDDLIAQGRQPGPEFRRLLDAAYDAQLEGRVRDRSEALKWLEHQA